MKNVSCILRVIALILSGLALVCTILAILQDKLDFCCCSDDDDFDDDFDDFEDWDD